jgi:hypothetical protein
VLAGLLVAGWFGWNWADGMLQNRAEAQVSDCQEGNTAIQVAVTPRVERPVQEAANRWNHARTVVHGHCVRVDVRALPSDTVLRALTSNETNALGGTPAAWLPESSNWVDRLTAKRPELLGSSAQSVASGPEADYPYLALACDEIDAVQQRAAQSFRAFLTAPAQAAEFTAAGLTPR